MTERARTGRKADKGVLSVARLRAILRFPNTGTFRDCLTLNEAKWMAEEILRKRKQRVGKVQP